MNDIPIRDIDESVLLRLISTPVPEGDRIEYKELLNLTSDEQKKKFLAGVASFANSSGGDMVFGVEARDGQPIALKALPAFNYDRVSLQIRDLVRTGIQPPIYTAEPHAVKLNSGGEVLVLRIAKTWAGPHLVTYNGEHRFYIRHGGGKRLMDVGEIRTAFTMADNIRERVQSWRFQRVADILADTTPCDLSGEAAVVVHMVPFRAFDPSFEANLREIERRRTTVRPLYSDGWGTYHEFDGVYVANGGVRREVTSLVQFFRNGAVEGVDTGMLAAHGDKRLIEAGLLENKLIEHLPSWLDTMSAVGVSAPVLIMLSLLNVRGYRMKPPIGFASMDARPINRDHLHTSPTVVETLRLSSKAKASNHPAALLRSHFDTIWNACGYPSCIGYDNSGQWLSGDAP